MTVIKFLAYRIIIGMLDFQNVPDGIKSAVKTELQNNGCGDMAN